MQHLTRRVCNMHACLHHVIHQPYRFRYTAYLYPHVCTGCGSDMISGEQLLCLPCLASLPHTRFAFYPGNDIERIFTGRMPVVAAHSECYFSKGQLIQQLIHHLKYHGNKAIGIYLGEMAGRSLLTSGRFQGIDYIIPMPLFADKGIQEGV